MFAGGWRRGELNDCNGVRMCIRNIKCLFVFAKSDTFRADAFLAVSLSRTSMRSINTIGACVDDRNRIGI